MLDLKEVKFFSFHIPSSEIKFHPNSFGDLDGRLFWWNEELYRGISAAWIPFLSRLIQDGVIQRMVERELLIETELTPWTTDGYEMVVQHRTIPFLSYAHEWCATMLKDAALTIFELAKELTPYDLALKDAHPWNILFDGSKPLFVDLTSIAPLSSISNRGWYEEFCQYTLYPLLLMSQGQEKIARRLLWEYDGIKKSDFLLLTSHRDPFAAVRLSISRFIHSWWQRIPQSYTRLFKGGLDLVFSRTSNWLSYPEARLDFLERTRRNVARIRIPFRGENQPTSAGKQNQNSGLARYDILYQILIEKRPSTVLDVGHHTGWLSMLAARICDRVISFDDDSRDTEQLYKNARQQGLQILPLVMDFARPTPAHGLSDHCYIAATERFQCDMVIALSLIEYLVIRRNLNFEQIVDGLAQFSKRWVVAEFVLHPDRAMYGGWIDRMPWYTLDNFANVLSKHFRDISVISFSSEGILFLCEK